MRAFHPNESLARVGISFGRPTLPPDLPLGALVVGAAIRLQSEDEGACPRTEEVLDYRRTPQQLIA